MLVHVTDRKSITLMQHIGNGDIYIAKSHSVSILHPGYGFRVFTPIFYFTMTMS